MESIVSGRVQSGLRFFSRVCLGVYFFLLARKLFSLFLPLLFFVSQDGEYNLCAYF